MVEHGILLAGGGALLRGFAERLEDETQIDAHLAEDPLTCVAVGAGRSLEELDTLTAGQGARGVRQGPAPRRPPRAARSFD